MNKTLTTEREQIKKHLPGTRPAWLPGKDKQRVPAAEEGQSRAQKWQEFIKSQKRAKCEAHLLQKVGKKLRKFRKNNPRQEETQRKLLPRDQVFQSCSFGYQLVETSSIQQVRSECG